MKKHAVQIGDLSITEHLLPGNINSRDVLPLHEQTKFITTRAVRVGGGYELYKIEKPVVEDKDRIRLLRHLISIKQASRNDLLHRIHFMIAENTRLAKFNTTLSSKNYEETLLQQQRHLREIQRTQQEREKIDQQLEEKRAYLAGVKCSTEGTILKVSESLDRLQQKLKADDERLFELKHYESASKPILCVKTQELMDELEAVRNENSRKIEEEKATMERRLERDRRDTQERVDKILTSASERAIASYPDRVKTELYLNSQMKFEVEYCKTELETLRMEVQVLVDKIAKVPRRKITDPGLFDEAKPPSEQQVYKFSDDDEVYTFNIEKKLHLPI